MFSYYGSKSKIVQYYPPPKFDTIIEPFAGSARYALRHGKNRKVILNDKYHVIYEIWKYLISATKEQVLNLPQLEKGQDIRGIPNLLEAEKMLMGFIVNYGVPYPHHIYTTWAHINNRVQQNKNTIMKYIDLIRDWKIMNVDYGRLENIEATWFIDPPYQIGGERYIHNNINYAKLSDWCKSRKGQVIVCEMSGAKWLPFKILKISQQGQVRDRFNEEVIWSNCYIGIKQYSFKDVHLYSTLHDDNNIHFVIESNYELYLTKRLNQPLLEIMCDSFQNTQRKMEQHYEVKL